MKTLYKVLISFLVGLCFIFAGISIGGLNQLSSIHFIENWDFRWKSYPISDVDYNSQTSIDDLKIDIYNANIQIEYSDHIDHLRVEARQLYNGFEVYEKNGTLVIKQPHYWWNSHHSKAKITVYVPHHYVFDEVNISMAAGVSTINSLKAKEIKLDGVAGTYKIINSECDIFKVDTVCSSMVLKELTVHNQLKIDNVMGSVKAILTGHENEYAYNVDVALGSVQIKNEKFSGIADRKTNHNADKDIKVDCVLGSVNVEMED